MAVSVLFAVCFSTFALAVGYVLRTRGKVFLDHTFGADPAVADSVHLLLNLGFYLVCGGLLLWNLGVAGSEDENAEAIFRSVAFRLGVSIFVVAAFHSLNLLVLSILNRNNRSE